MNGFLFGTVPYILFAVALVGGVRRFGAARETVTTYSSQLLEARLQYWGAVSWHYGILAVLLLHLCAIFLPGALETLLSAPGRLLMVELSGFALGLTALVGLLVLVGRRFVLRGRTTWLDWTVMALLLVQVGTGLWIAVTARWGFAWFTRAAGSAGSMRKNQPSPAGELFTRLGFSTIAWFASITLPASGA